MNVDDTGSTAPKTGTLTDTALTGLGMGPAGITYSGLANLNLGLGSGGDALLIASTWATTAYRIDSGNGDDHLTLGAGDLDTLRGPVHFLGSGGNDQVVVDDSGNAKKVDYQVTPSAVTSTAQPGQPPRTFAGLVFDGTTEFLSLEGSNATNTFDVTPSFATTFRMDGNLLAPGVPPRNGDFLRIDTDDVFGEVLSLTPGVRGAGLWQFTSGQKPVQFTSIERFNDVQAEAVFSDSGSQSTSAVKVFDPKTGWLRFDVPAVRLFGGAACNGVRAVTGDLTGDGIPDLVVGPNGGTDVVIDIFDGVDGHLVREFRPYPDCPKFCGGVELAIGDVNGDGWNDLIVGPGDAEVVPIRAFDGGPSGNFRQIGSDLNPFSSYNTCFVSLAVADQNVNGGSNTGLIWVGSSVKGIATVEAFRMNASEVYEAVPGSLFYPFGTNCPSGARVATGDVNGDGIDDVIVSQGPGGAPIVQAFDGANFGAALSGPFPASDDPRSIDAVFISAFDYTGDGKTDFFSWFQSPGGVTGQVSRSTPAGSLIDPFTANVGSFPDLSGIWSSGGRQAMISQVGTQLTLTDADGQVTQACLVGSCVISTKTGLTLAQIDGDVLRFCDGTDWEQIDLTGMYSVGGKLARVQQHGLDLRVFDSQGTLFGEKIASPQSALPTLASGISGDLSPGLIHWSDGTTWHKLDVTEKYQNLSCDRVRAVTNGIGDIILVNRAGGTSLGRWIDPSHLAAVDWGGVTGLVQDAQIRWANGTVWNKDAHVNGTTALGGSVSLDVDSDSILLCNRFGGTSRARLTDPQTIYAIDWHVTGTLLGDHIQWSNGTVWKDFGLTGLNAAFGDVKTFPFPNIRLTGDNSKGSSIAIELRQNDLFVTNKLGETVAAQLINPGTIYVANWNVTGTLSNGKINWSNGTTWRNFDSVLLGYILGM